MTHQKMSFSDAVESLAQRFHVPLENVEEREAKGPNKAVLKEALDYACHFFHFTLLHTEEGHEALHYLYGRGLDLEFIRHFKLGLAPKEAGSLPQGHAGKKYPRCCAHGRRPYQLTKDGQWRDFFSGRHHVPHFITREKSLGFPAENIMKRLLVENISILPRLPCLKNRGSYSG